MFMQHNCNEGKVQQTPSDLIGMSFEEIMKLRDQLGAKVYKEAVLGVSSNYCIGNSHTSGNFKRLNKNRPRELSAKKPVPFLGRDERTKCKSNIERRDPRFDERSGVYNVKKFKENYKFLSDLREKEINELKNEISRCIDQDEKEEIKKRMLTLINKNVEEKNWHRKQQLLMEENIFIQKSKLEGKKPHYATKRERHAKELVAKFEDLKQRGKLSKHLERRRKKNAVKDRKKYSFLENFML